jgi:hypothetical protein
MIKLVNVSKLLERNYCYTEELHEGKVVYIVYGPRATYSYVICSSRHYSDMDHHDDILTNLPHCISICIQIIEILH